MFRAYSLERRDRAPLSRRRIFATRPRAVSGMIIRRRISASSPARTTLILELGNLLPRGGGALSRLFHQRISNTDPAHSKWSGYASIYWSDSNADGRQDSSEVCRVSGKVDSVRLPKQAYYVYRVMQNPAPDIHIIGHWTYPRTR
jgi:beta-galactosidase